MKGYEYSSNEYPLYNIDDVKKFILDNMCCYLSVYVFYDNSETLIVELMKNLREEIREFHNQYRKLL